MCKLMNEIFTCTHKELDELCEEIRADERKKFAEWVEDQNSTDSLPYNASDILFEYEKND